MVQEQPGSGPIDPLTSWMDGRQHEPLRTASPQAMAASLRRLLETEAAYGDAFDDDRLARAAASMARAGHYLGPAVAMAWLIERPDRLRISIVLSFLMVAWQSGDGAPAPDPSLVDELQRLYEPLHHDLLLENKLLWVLSTAVRSGLPLPLEARIRARLRSARDTPGRQPAMRALLDAILGNAKDGGVQASEL